MAPLVLFAVALLARMAVGALHVDPAYPDSYYYVNVAQALAAGRGFTVDYVWNYVDVGGTLPATGVLPIPSNAHWMPLAALVQVPFIWLLGPTALASALPFWLIGATAAPLAYLIGRDAGLERGICLTAGLLTAVPAAVLPFMAQPDNFGLYMTLGAVALWLCVRAARRDRWAWLVGGAVVGLATLSRNDGVLLGVPFALLAARDVLLGERRLHSVALGAACALGFLVVAGPWFARQIVEFGSISPSAASGRVLWLTDYRQLWSAGPPPTLDSFLALGPAELLASRLQGLVAALAVFALLPLAVVMAPLAVVGAWQRRGDPAFAPFFTYGAVFVAASALLFAAHVAHGMFLHSAVALLPHTFLLVGVGLWRAVDWTAARRPSWHAPTARRVFAGGLVGVALLAGVLQTATTVAEWRAVNDPRQAVGVPATGLSPTAQLEREVHMSADPGALRYLWQVPGVVTPDDPLPVIEQAARRYGVRWLVLERENIVPALAPVLRGELRPAWLSAPVAVVGGAAAAGGSQATAAVGPAAPSAASVPQLAIYAVCLQPDDERCAR